MEVQAHVLAINDILFDHISHASKSVHVILPTLTDNELADTLQELARGGSDVHILLREAGHNIESCPLASSLRVAGCNVDAVFFSPGDIESNKRFLWIIDQSTVITGFFDWTHQSEECSSRIIVASDDTSLLSECARFFSSFSTRRRLYNPVDMLRLLHRVDAVRNLLFLEDEEMLLLQIPKLEEANSIEGITEIVDMLKRGGWPEALTLTEAFLVHNRAVVVFEDPAIASLQFEAMLLELELVAFTAEEAELKRLIHEFDRRQHLAVGDVLEEYLRLRHTLLSAQTPPEEASEEKLEAEQEYEEYKQSRLQDAGEPDVATLSQEAKDELKLLYRACAMLCHPDRVTDADTEQAHNLFIRVNEYYQTGNLEGLRNLHSSISQGRLFADKALSINEAQLLKQLVLRLSGQIQNLLHSCAHLRQTEVFQTAVSLADWDAHFSAFRSDLEQRIQELQDEIGRLQHG